MGGEALSLISPGYQAENRALMHAVKGYGNGGWRHAKAIAEYAEQLEARSLLDYGCGRGTLRHALWAIPWHGRIAEYEPAIPKKAGMPKKADLVVCTDVLEHVEPDCLMAVLSHLRRLGRRGGYVSIATRPSNKTLPDGRNAHLIVQPAKWWLRQLRAVGWKVWKARRVQRKHAEPSDPDRAVVVWLH